MPFVPPCGDDQTPCIGWLCPKKLFGRSTKGFKKYFVLQDHHPAAAAYYCELLAWRDGEGVDFIMRRRRVSDDADLYFRSEADAVAFKLRWL